MPRRLIKIIALVLTSAGSVLGQTHKPGVELQSLLNTHYNEATGGFVVEDLQVAYPPANISDAKFVITNRAGRVVANLPLRYEAIGFPEFGHFRPASGNSGIIRVGQSGEFLISIVVNGETVTSMPFSLREETSSDPVNPGKRFVPDGPWRDMAYFKVEPNNSNGEMSFNWWMSRTELPAGTKQPRLTIHVVANGNEVAASSGSGAGPYDRFFYQYNHLPMLPGNRPLTLADMSKLNGDISVVLKANGTPVKTYKASVSDGQLQHYSRSALNIEPHTQWISPRFIDVSSGTNSRSKLYVMYWMKKQ